MIPVQSYVAIDLEMTGLHPKRDRIIEIAAIRVRGDNVEETFHRMVNPERMIAKETTEITGICESHMENAISIKEAMDQFLAFVGSDVWIGHGIRHDVAFLKQAAVNEDRKLLISAIDTLTISRIMLPELESKRLCDLCHYFQIPHVPHRALEDAVATHQVYQKLRSLSDKGELASCFAPQEMTYHTKKQTPMSVRQQERLLRLLKERAMSVPEGMGSLTRSEADRLMDQILSSTITKGL